MLIDKVKFIYERTKKPIRKTILDAASNPNNFEILIIIVGNIETIMSSIKTISHKLPYFIEIFLLFILCIMSIT